MFTSSNHRRLGQQLLLSLCVMLLAAETHAQPATRYIVAQLASAPSARTRATLSAAGLREVAYLPGRGLLLERTSTSADLTAATWQSLGDVLGLAAYSAIDRISRELTSETLDPRLGNETPLLIHVMPGKDAREVPGLLTRLGLPVLGQAVAGATTRLSTLVPRSQAKAVAEQLAALGDVLFVERVHRLGFFNDRSAGTVQSGKQGTAAGANPIWDHGLHGEGQIIGIIDSGIDVDGCWFSDPSGKLPKTNTWSMAGGYASEVDASHRKILAYDFLYSCDQWTTDPACEMPSDKSDWDNNGHGTHCSGSMVGDRSAKTNNGMAPAAKIVMQDGGAKTNACSDMPGLGCPVVDLYPIFQQAFAQGVRVHNNSYGDNEDAAVPEQSNYSARSQDVDRFMWDHKDMLIVFAAGNSGSGNKDFSVCSPSTNKNGISVGSVRTTATSSSDNDISSFSSRGWSADGRVKPDLLAPGCTASAGNDGDITSNNCTQDSGCGTSYAAPILVGAAALIRQYFSDGFYPSGAKNAADALQPTAALVKAMLHNGAVAVTGKDNAGQAITPIPSNEQGWGRIQLDRALVFQGAPRKLYLDDHRMGFAAGEQSTVAYTFAGVEPGEPFKVTLTWTDFPGMVDAAPSAPKLDDPSGLNAAQLVNDLDLVVTNGAASYLGNVFASGASAPAGMADRRNNVEQVLIAAPSGGDVVVSVKAERIMQAGQDYALVATGRWASAAVSPAAPGGTAGSPATAGGQAPQAGQGQAGAGAGADAGGTAGVAAAAGGVTAVAGQPAEAPTVMTTAGTATPQAGTVGTRTLSNTGSDSQAPSDMSSKSGGCSVSRASTSTIEPGWLSLSCLGSCLVLLVRRRRRYRR